MNARKQRSPAYVSLVASATLVLALAASAVFDAAWLLLVPAAVVVFAAVGAIHVAQDGEDGRVGAAGAALIRIGCVALLATAAAGFVVVAVRGVEPAWLSTAMLISGVLLVAGEAAFGLALATTHLVPRRLGILFSAAIPIGVAIDFLPQVLVPVSSFLTGVGVYIGLGLFALALARLGAAATRARGDQIRATEAGPRRDQWSWHGVSQRPDLRSPNGI